ncbi:MAG: PmoA family protein [Planctomycetaceae bacterium]|nr:PmoA family protein [Planctomycetaceae bacterium]
MRSLLLCCTLCVVSSVALADDEVVLTRGSSTLKATIGGEVFTVYRFGEDLPKPYLFPVTAPGAWELLAAAEPGDETVAGRRAMICSEEVGSGDGKLTFGALVTIDKVDGEKAHVAGSDLWIQRSDAAPLAGTVTRVVDLDPPKIKDRRDPRYYDHPHHKGVWLSVDEVNGIKFWNEDGRIVSHKVEVLTARGNPAVFCRVNHWLDTDGKPLVQETSVISLYANRLLTCDVRFEAIEKEVTFGDTKEGMFAIRLPNSMREFISESPVVNADGLSGTKACWGLESNWIDYTGKIDGELFGVTLMDHPENLWRSRYHVRDYGLFAINPFGAKAYSGGKEPDQPLTLKPGAAGARFRYGLYVHRGSLDDGHVADRYKQFVTAE